MCDHKVLLEGATIPIEYKPEFCPRCVMNGPEKKSNIQIAREILTNVRFTDDDYDEEYREQTVMAIERVLISKDALLAQYQEALGVKDEALRFYAEQKHLTHKAWIEQHGPDAGTESRSITVTDYGETAKKALAHQPPSDRKEAV